ncbi:MoxR family ATPase [Clostridium estertheticum]|uniref:AAA family ATPase n=1 Tax=Clostridium estertheticum TaxID=238834 RepID=UPI0013E951DD|nr:MoxR family ATPase [Clostridium estertheticum]MBZ9685163.1 MoxR family ATPase [Clostridium estertheticum]
MEVEKFKLFASKITKNVNKVIVGKEKNITKIIVAFISSGHVLLEDVPGLGKTKLARSLSKSMNCSFKRIQFTPDLLPSDLVGIYYYNQKIQEFEYRQGPILSQFLLADEINRATPRTQSALLECMEERQVTVEGNTIKLNKPFFIIATQNPVEQFGTFPLPEAQLDRFFMKISMGYPDFNDEKNMIDRFITNDPLEDLQPVVSMEEIEYVQNNYNQVHVSEELKKYILNIVVATRNHKDVELGCSPRGTLNLIKGSQALAAISGRGYVIPEDVKELAVAILSHRLILKSEMNLGNDKASEIIEEIINTIEAPLEKL